MDRPSPATPHSPSPATSPAAPRAVRRGFDHVDTFVFDLDNTLYPHHLNLWQQVDDRIRNYIAKFLGLTYEDAFRKQKDFYRRYGTTMRGLMIEHGMEPDDFLDYVHRIDHSPITPNPALGAALEKLPGRKLILTNGTRVHADAVMKRLGGQCGRNLGVSVWSLPKRALFPRPNGVDAGNFISRDCIGERPRADSEDVAALVDEMASRLDRGLGGRRPHERRLPRFQKERTGA